MEQTPTTPSFTVVWKGVVGLVFLALLWYAWSRPLPSIPSPSPKAEKYEVLHQGKDTVNSEPIFLAKNKMHIAILCSGRIQSPNLADSVAHFQALRASLAPHHVAFFFSLNAEITTNADVSAFCTALNIREKDSVCVSANTYPNVQNVHRLESVWSMYTHNQGAFRVMEAYERVHNLRFDVVVKYRTDIVSDTPLPFPSPIEEGVLYVPQGADWGGLNDQIALGSRETMRIYCDCVNALVDLHRNERVRWHPETLLLAYIKRRTKLTMRRFPFPYELWKNKYKTRRH